MSKLTPKNTCGRVDYDYPNTLSGVWLAVGMRERAPIEDFHIALFPKFTADGTLREVDVIAWATGFETTGWYMLVAPAGVPRDVMQVLNAAANRAMKEPDVGGKLAAQGVEWTGGTLEQADQFLRGEMTRWARIAKEAGMKAD